MAVGDPHGDHPPRRMPEAETIRIHGLRPADLADAPPLEEVLDLMLEASPGGCSSLTRRGSSADSSTPR